MENRSHLKVLHTSDWHLGQILHEKNRDDEFNQFLQWMLDTIERENIDVLLIAGDIFDTSNPPYSAQKMYYDFCTKLSHTCCRHAVITSGNHDSLSFIDVPAQLLSYMNIHVIGQARFGIGKSGKPEDEIVVLKDRNGEDELIVAAVPFLSESDLRYSSGGEEIETKEQRVLAGLADHYEKVAKAADHLRAGRDIPVIGMGHLFVSQCAIGNDNGERMTYVGNLGGVSADIFGPEFDYVALGHLHGSQMVAKRENVRYSGSPIVMGFGEAGQQKSVCMLDFEGRNLSISEYPVKSFHKIARIIGDKTEITQQIQKLIEENEEVYISVIYTGNAYIDNVMSLVDAAVGDSQLIRCLDTQNKYAFERIKNGESASLNRMTLDDLNELAVFNKRLDLLPDCPEERRTELIKTFKDLMIMVQGE